MILKVTKDSIIGIEPGEKICLTAVGDNTIRFQGSPNCKIIDENWNVTPMKARHVKTGMEDGDAYIENGEMKAVLSKWGRITYYRNGKEILTEKPELAFNGVPRYYRNICGDLWKARVNFMPHEGEHFFGLGHEATGCFDLKGVCSDLRHINTKSSIPFVYSSLGFGFLWNMPSTGSVELAANRTRFSSDCTKQVDYFVIGGEPKEVLSTLADLSGHAPKMPEWAMGFWQCKLRYETQDQLLEVARRFKKENIPLSVIVIDYFHWTEQGDYKFDPKYWPDPKAMSKELHDMGVKLMVSMWPTINEKSINYRYMNENNMLIRTANGSNRVFEFHGMNAEIDPTNPETREYVYEKLKEGYLDNGVDALWFDEAEPEIHPTHFDNIILDIGRGDEVGLLYPYYYSQLVYDGMKKDGRDDIVTLARAAYLGSQKFGTLVWSGDVYSSFESLSEQVKSGLNMAMCGIPWWTTDIGGFWGAEYEDREYFKELLVRWFQYGTFCPVMRLHGNRGNADPNDKLFEPSGEGNEIWCYGDEIYKILKGLIELRYRLVPYIKKQMDLASKEGTPVMRPVFFDYPSDENTYHYGEEFLFGPDILTAPITKQGATSKKVYLPEGEWILERTREEYAGGKEYEVSAKLDEMIVFIKKGSDVIELF